MKVYVNRSVVPGPWGGGNAFLRALNADADIEQTPIAPAHALIVGLDADNQHLSADAILMYAENQMPHLKVHMRINENDARKGTSGVDDKLLAVAKRCHSVIFVSEWLRDYFFEHDEAWKNIKSTVIHNGVDKKVFNANESSQPRRIVTHHWSDNPMKGADFYLKLDEFVGKHPEFAFTYVGRSATQFKHSNVVPPLGPDALAKELNTHSVYVSASRFDPGPNHILEALACELPTYVYKDGGGCVEFAGVDHVYGDWKELEALLLSEQYERNTQFVPTDWETCIHKYKKFMTEVG